MTCYIFNSSEKILDTMFHVNNAYLPYAIRQGSCNIWTVLLRRERVAWRVEVGRGPSATSDSHVIDRPLPLQAHGPCQEHPALDDTQSVPPVCRARKISYVNSEGLHDSAYSTIFTWLPHIDKAVCAAVFVWL